MAASLVISTIIVTRSSVNVTADVDAVKHVADSEQLHTTMRTTMQQHHRQTVKLLLLVYLLMFGNCSSAQEVHQQQKFDCLAMVLLHCGPCCGVQLLSVSQM